MRTTLLNPTIWLLVVLLGRAAWAMVRERPGAEPLAATVRFATSRPVLIALALAVVGALGSRVLIGYLSPGAYAEEVLAARSFLAERRIYGGNDRAEFVRWAKEERPASAPWTLPGLSTCQASALEHRPQFYTSQAHTPMLLLGSVPVVLLIGGHGLYLTILVLSAALLAGAWSMLVAGYRLYAIPGGALVAALALAGWQPVVAGLRQGDAVLAAASLVVIGWGLLRRGRTLTAGIAVGTAAALSLPAAVSILALARWPRALAASCFTVGLFASAALAAGGPMMFVDFAGNVTAAARTYAMAMPNYAFGGRLAGAHEALVGWLSYAAVALVICGWWRARSVDDAFAWFSGLALLAAPLAWSQHVTLALLPLAWLLSKVCRHQSSAGVLAWSILVLAVSLPDPAVAIIGDRLPTLGGTVWPIVPFAVALLWAWLVIASWTGRHATMPEATALP